MIYVTYQRLSELPVSQEVYGRLTVEGHAEYAPPEMPDTVCAAVSAQVQAFLLFLRARCIPHRAVERTGYTEVEFRSPAVGRNASIELFAATQMLMIGLKAVAHDYPDNVRII